MKAFFFLASLASAFAGNALLPTGPAPVATPEPIVACDNTIVVQVRTRRGKPLRNHQALVTLTDPTGQTVFLSLITNSKGRVVFSGVCDGTYSITAVNLVNGRRATCSITISGGARKWVQCQLK